MVKNRISFSKLSKEYSNLTNLHVHLKPAKIEDISRVIDYILKEPLNPQELEEFSREKSYTKALGNVLGVKRIAINI